MNVFVDGLLSFLWMDYCWIKFLAKHSDFFTHKEKKTSASMTHRSFVVSVASFCLKQGVQRLEWEEPPKPLFIQMKPSIPEFELTTFGL